MLNIEYIGLSEISGPLVILDGVRGAGYEELVSLSGPFGERTGRVIAIEGDRVVIQVFEGTAGISLTDTRTRLSGAPMMMELGPDMLGRVFDGAGRVADGLGEIRVEARADINGSAINPVRREYPRDFIETGISAIDVCSTLIRGQKLPIFSGSGLPHNALAVQIARQAAKQRSGGGKASGGKDSNGKTGNGTSTVGSDGSNAGQTAIVFAAMGVKADVADYFRRSFEESGASSRVMMLCNLASDPIVERIVTPRCALTAAEYLAFTLGYDVLVIMTDMTSYAEALREVSSSKGEIPGRRGFPGYMYSDLASIYERAGRIKGRPGSVTQLPILTMPNDDITHPVPDLTGYITEGQIVLDRSLERAGIYPPVSVLASLSRLMKDGIGEKYTRADHAAVSGQLYAACAKVQDARSLASVVGESELSAVDQAYLRFGEAFERRFLSQPRAESRTIAESLDLAWELLALLPRSELDRIDPKLVEEKLGRQ